MRGSYCCGYPSRYIGPAGDGQSVWQCLWCGLKYVAPDPLRRRSMVHLAAVGAALAMLAGCATPWVTARGAITAADAAIDALPEDIAGAEHAADLASARLATAEALDLGMEACAIWEREATATTPTGWQKWVSDALAASAHILEIVKAAGVEVPAAVGLAIAGLQLLLPMLGG